MITGFPIKFPDWTISQWIINAVGGVTARGAIHRLMGAILLLAGVWHVLWVVTSPRAGGSSFACCRSATTPGALSAS